MAQHGDGLAALGDWSCACGAGSAPPLSVWPAHPGISAPQSLGTGLVGIQARSFLHLERLSKEIPLWSGRQRCFPLGYTEGFGALCLHPGPGSLDGMARSITPQVLRTERIGKSNLSVSARKRHSSSSKVWP